MAAGRRVAVAVGIGVDVRVGCWVGDGVGDGVVGMGVGVMVADGTGVALGRAAKMAGARKAASKVATARVATASGVTRPGSNASATALGTRPEAQADSMPAAAKLARAKGMSVRRDGKGFMCTSRPAVPGFRVPALPAGVAGAARSGWLVSARPGSQTRGA